jgi:phosphoglycerate dehydrogenase-like enzyme
MATKAQLLVIAPPHHPALHDLQRLDALADISVSEEMAELEHLAPMAEVILWTGLSAAAVNFPDLWQRAHAVRWIHSLTAGVEKLLFPALVGSPVPLTNARGVFKRALAEFAVLGILFHTKKVRRLIDNQRERKWDDFSVRFADGHVLGIVGYGEIGRECALLAKGLGMRIHALRRHPEKSAADPLLDRVFEPAELRDMLAGVDVLVCAAPLTPQTHHMISDAEFRVMRRSAIIVNVGRGPVIDEAALTRALESGLIAGASLDVFEHEPLPPASPLWSMENVLISPHCTDRTVDPDWLELSMRLFFENFDRYRSGSPLANLVDKHAGY